ncbi:ATP synthase protein I-like protein [Wolffia australiana]
MAALQSSVACFCVAVRSSSSESSSLQPPGRSPPSSSSSAFDPRQTKVILPKKKPQKWSTGVAPGDYGGPPTTTKLRKYWGGRGEEDPVTATDDFIWNKNFHDRMKRLIDEEAAKPAPAGFLPSKADSGFLSLNRAMSLDSVHLDLTRELAPPPKPVLEEQVEAARRGRSVASERLSNASSPKWRLAPTRKEQAKWDRASKGATGGSDEILRETKKPRGDPEVLRARSREQYFKLKKKMQVLTLGIGGVGLVSAYVSYSPEIAASFGMGFLGSLAYVRMLGNSVDSLADGAGGLVKGAAGQPRLLVPVVLVMVYNRWNEFLVPDHGFIHLELIPILLGFFTYKAATFVQAIEEALTPISNRNEA